MSQALSPAGQQTEPGWQRIRRFQDQGMDLASAAIAAGGERRPDGMIWLDGVPVTYGGTSAGKTAYGAVGAAFFFGIPALISRLRGE